MSDNKNLLNIPPITPICGHVARALDFFNRGVKYFAIGKPTPWANTDGAGNEVPDFPDVQAAGLIETIGYKRVDNQFIVVPDSTGTLSFKNQKWRAITPETAYLEKARWVWLETLLVPEDFNLEDYRQIGVFSSLVPNSSAAPQKTALYPADVANAGVLEFLDNRRPLNRLQDQDEQFVIILEF